jgi:hypothetical protein
MKHVSAGIRRFVGLALVVVTVSCGVSPSAPSSPESSLTGTWRGTVTIQVNPNAANPSPATIGTTTWTFEVVPQTNLQTFRTTIQSDNTSLPITMIALTALVPGNTPPAHISTQGMYNSPRGCQGTFESAGTADATHIDADFTGVDCQLATFTGSVMLTKQ